MRHELSNTISVLWHLGEVITDKMDFKPEVKREPTFIPHRFGDEWKTYVHMLDGINQSTRFITGDEMVRDRKSIKFHEDVLMPVVRQGPYMLKQFFTDEQIETIISNQVIRIFYRNFITGAPKEKFFNARLLVFPSDPFSPKHPSIKLRVSRGRFFLVFFNLVINALKFSHKQKIPEFLVQNSYNPTLQYNKKDQQVRKYNETDRRVQIDIFVERLEQCEDKKYEGGLQVKFCDYGPGIDDRVRNAIFDKSVREPRWINSDYDGEGIGLWVARKIVEAHQGQITLERKESPTTFCLRFPKSIFDSPVK